MLLRFYSIFVLSHIYYFNFDQVYKPNILTSTIPNRCTNKKNLTTSEFKQNGVVDLFDVIHVGVFYL